MKRRLFLLKVIVVLSLFCHSAYAASTGSAGINNTAPQVSAFSINTLRTDDVYYLAFDVSDDNQLTDIANITVVVWDNSTTTFGASNNNTNHYTFLWVPSSWSEQDLTGHLNSSTQPGSLTVGSGTWSLNLTFTPSTLVSNFTVRVSATDESGASDTEDGNITHDILKISTFVRGVANERLYVKLVYEYDSAVIASGNVSFAGTIGTSNSSGWVDFDLSSFPSFDWGQTCYGVSDVLYNITTPGSNQTITLAKNWRVVGGNATVDSLSLSSGVLKINFNVTSGTYVTEISGSKPRYILNTTYDLSSEYTTKMTVNHDGQYNLSVSFQSWGPTYVQSFDTGRLTSVSLVSQVLTLVTAGSGTGEVYVDCTTRGAPQSTSGFTGTPTYSPALALMWGNYNANESTLMVGWTAAAGSEGGSSSGSPSIIDIELGDITIEAHKGSEEIFRIAIKWSGVPSLDLQSITFLENSKWFSLESEMPLRLEGEGPVKSAYAEGIVSPSSDATEGNYTITYEVMVRVAGFSTISKRGFIYLTVKPVKPFVQPDMPAADLIGYAIGGVIIIGLGAAFYRREQRPRSR